MSSLVTLYHGSRNLGTLDRATLFEGMLDFFTQALGATKAGIYLPKEGRWILLGQRGWAERDAYPRALDFGQGLIGKAGAEKRVVSLREWLDAELAASPDQIEGNADAVMAGALLDPAGETVAVYAVQAMPLLRFNSAAVGLLTLLLDWGAEALEKCVRIDELKAKSIRHEDFGVYNDLYFVDRTGQEFSRSGLYALPFSVLLVSPRPAAEAPAAARLLELHALCRVLRDLSRDFDIVTTTPYAEAPFGILMMTTTREKADEMKLRIEAAHAKLGLPSPLRIGIGSFKHGMKDKEEIFAQARAELG